MSGKGIILAAAGLGAVALVLKAASQATSAPASKQQTYVEKTLASAKAKQSGTVTKAKQAGKKVTAEINSATKAIDALLK
jgi:uncharacterized cupredoxin-like copper-binding protein